MQFIQKIIDGITWVVGKIPAVGNAIRSNRVTQTQNNNSVVNNNNVTNNYGGMGGFNSLTPLARGIYAIP
jgi:hypothetical protein